jgi:hypothetical protein
MRSRIFFDQEGARAGHLVRVLDHALEDSVVRRARLAIAWLGTEALRESYFTTFWLARGELPENPVEEAVLALWRLAGPGSRCAGAEWWIGRSYTTDVPVGFHFDQDVRSRRGLRHPRLSSVFFFNRVRGGQLAVTDQRAGRGGQPRPAVARELQVVAPRRNRYALFDGSLFHGVLDARGRAPGRKLAGSPGRLRITLVVNFWDRRPAKVPRWRDARVYRALAGERGPR